MRLSAHATLIAGHVLLIFLYSMTIARGLTNADYQAFAMASGPWFSIVAGGPVFYLWGRFLAKKFPANGRLIGLIVWGLYSATDLTIVLLVHTEFTPLFVTQWIASQSVKLVAILWATREHPQ